MDIFLDKFQLCRKNKSEDNTFLKLTSVGKYTGNIGGGGELEGIAVNFGKYFLCSLQRNFI